MEKLTYFANGAACMLFMLASLHFRRKPQNKTFNLVLYHVLLFWAILFWKDILLMLPAIRRSEYAETLLMSIDMWAVAACAFYLMALLRPLALTRKFVASNLLPYILFTVFYIITGNYRIFVANTVYAIMYGIVALFYFVREIKRYNRLLQNNYSNLDYINVRWLKQALGLLVCCLVVWIYNCFFPSPPVDFAYYTTSIVLWSVICYYSDRQEIVSELEEVNRPEETDNLKSNYVFVPLLQKLLTPEFLSDNPQLTVKELASLLGTNRTYLSEYLNNELNTNFFDFINSYRLQQAEVFLSDSNCRYTLEEIAEKTGFNSISTFRRAFYKKHNCTPSQFKKLQSKSFF